MMYLLYAIGTLSDNMLIYLLIISGVILFGLIAVIVGLFVRLKQLEKHQYNDELELSAEIDI